MPETSQRPPIAAAPLSVVLPAHNQGSEFDEVVSAWIKYLDGLEREYEILLVDDGSSDETGIEADALAQRCSRLRVFHHPAHQGMGAALRTGIAAAQHPLLFYTACDKQYQPADLQRLLENIDKVDVVTGYRVERPPPGWLVWLDRLYRLFVRVIIGLAPEPRDCWLGWSGYWRRWLGRWIFGVRVRDSECAFRLFRRDIFGRIPIQSDGVLAHIEILAKANFLGCWMAEVPVTCLPRRGHSKPAESYQRTRLEMRQLFRRPDFGPAILDRIG